MINNPTWLELREAGKVPERKGPFPSASLKTTLREFMAARPKAFITVVSVTEAGPDFQDGPECLEMLDMRSSPTARKHRASTAAAFRGDGPEDRDIILALFAPQSDHKDGCLFKGNPNMPCQCGFAEVVGRYRWALRRAREIAAEHHGAAWKARGPDEQREPWPDLAPSAVTPRDHQPENRR